MSQHQGAVGQGGSGKVLSNHDRTAEPEVESLSLNPTSAHQRSHQPQPCSAVFPKGNFQFLSGLRHHQPGEHMVSLGARGLQQLQVGPVLILSELKLHAPLRPIPSSLPWGTHAHRPFFQSSAPAKATSLW